MPRRDADLVPAGFDRSTLDSPLEIRVCHVCRVDFFVDTSLATDRKRIYCSERCKERGSHIRTFLRRNNYELDVVAFLDNPDAFPPISGRKSAFVNKTRKSGPPSKPVPKSQRLLQTTATVRHDPALKLEHEKTKRRTEEARARKAASQATEAKRKAEAAKHERERLKHISEQTAAIKDAHAALGLLPLSEREDVLSGKRTFLPEEDIARQRSAINVIVENNLIVAEKVLTGEVSWSPQQVTVFRTLLNKVVPDAASQKATGPTSKPVGEMTIDELEALVAAQKQAIPVSEQ